MPPVEIEEVAPNAVVVAAEHSEKFELVKNMLARLNEEADVEQRDDQSAFDFQMSIVAKILSGETEEEIFEAQEAGGMSGQDFTNRPFRVIASDVQFIKTGVRTGSSFPYYVRMKVIEVATGEEESLTCGGFSVVPVLWALRERGFLNNETPLALSFKATATLSGNTRLSLVPFKEPVKKSKNSR